MSNFDERVEGVMHRGLYVLKLEDDYWYIGESSTEFSKKFNMKSIEIRIRQNFGQKIGYHEASDWCKLHKPIKVEEIINIGLKSYKESEFLENALTKVYVERYGADKVRGGISCLGENKKKDISSDTKEEILGICEIDGLD